ncbi:MAG TPA: dihydroneopterin aldolase [Ferruginibacter sp.]|nr:dihydroneopterin aldolase [Ferruginibacter sp.]HPH90653.1 dihydroneopterin aldolase [Ferruginibacter sp.]
MFTIHLHHLKFFAYHGLYEEERKAGNNFEMDVDVIADIPGTITKLEQTVDYAHVYAIIDERMKQPTALLETLVHDLVEKIHDYDNRIKSVSISIKKLSAPIKFFNGVVGVSYKKDF